MNNIEQWDIRWIEKAHQFAEWSKDISNKVGCVIVDPDNRLISQGYNGFPSGIDDSIKERYTRENDAKYYFTVHSEQNALFAAAKNGTSIKGCTLYSTFFPCADCAKGIIQTGIKRVVTYKPQLDHHKYGISFSISLILFKEAGIEVCYLEKK